MTIYLEVNAQKLICLTNEYIAADTVNYIDCNFKFSDEWNGFIKTAIFSNGAENYSVLLEDDKCLVPKEVLSGVFGISVYGTQNDTIYKRITSDIVYITVCDSGYTNGQTPETPTPSVYEAIAAQYEDCKKCLSICKKELEQQKTFIAKSIPHTGLSGNPITVTDALAEEQPLEMCVYGDGIGDLNNGMYEIPIKNSGKNIFDLANMKWKVATSGNTSYEFNNNTVTIKRTTASTTSCAVYTNISLQAGTYTVSVSNISINGTFADTAPWVYSPAFSSVYKSMGFKKTFTLDEDKTTQIYLYNAATDGTAGSTATFSVQIEMGSAATDYEPYRKQQTATAILDTPLTGGEYINLVSKKRNNETDITVNGNIALFDGINNITCQTVVAPSKLEISYYQDINKVLAGLKNAS